MKRISRGFHPGTESLEAMVLMSVTPSASKISAEVWAAGTMRQVAETQGAVRGHYLATAEDSRAADAPLAVGLDGSGKLRGLGRVSMVGTLNFGGFLARGTPDVSGTVTLTNARGSLTVRLTGTGGSGQIPDARFVLKAEIVSGTGIYAHQLGKGDAHAQFGKSVVRSVAAPSPIGGSLTLQLRLKKPAL